jgi:hypothetical protein
MSNRTGVLIALAALGSASATISSAQSGDPRMGHWGQLPGPGSIGMHVTYEDLGDGRYRYTMFPHYVPVSQLIFEGKCDGGTYPIRDGNGKTTGNTLSCRVTGPRSFEYLYTAANQTVWATSAGVETVSEDSNILAWDAIHRDVNGKTVEELNLRFSRRDDEQPRN